MIDFTTLLERLGRDPDERLSMNGYDKAGRFGSVITTVAKAPGIAGAMTEADCWYGTAVIHNRVTKGRGWARDVTGVRELHIDLDVKPGGMPDYDTAVAVIDDLSNMLGTPPVAIVASGHGLQPHWAIERGQGTDWPDETDPSWRAAVVLWRRWHRLVLHVAEIRGGHIDNTSDLSRVLRVPGTTNRKAEPVPVTVAFPGGAPVTLDRLAEALDEYGVPELAGDDEVLGDVISTPAGWSWSKHTCRYATAMIAGWGSETPDARHPWLVSQAVRLAAAHRLGCITQHDHQQAVAALVARFRALLANGRQRRDEAHGEISDALTWATARVSTYPNNTRCAAELGGHSHHQPPDDDPWPDEDPFVAEQPSTQPTASGGGLNRRRRPDEPNPNGHHATPDEIPISLDQCHKVFQKWLGVEYDLDVLDAVLCTLAAEQLDGDPLWLLVISGPGAAKTETVQACAGAGAFVTSTISSDAALLSGSPKKDKAKDATGGLLRRIGNTGVLVIKDVTSILSANRDLRATVLAAMREVYDGYWERNLGVDGGRSLAWSGRIAVIGAVTTAWDTAHTAVSTMGDRFVLIRLDSSTGRQAAFRKTMANTGDEITMRAELATAVGGVLAGINESADLTLTDPEIEQLLPAADVVTLARTGVEFDYKGDVIDAHAPEMPTRFARQLQQIVRGGLALGMDHDNAMRLAIRCARDTMPPVRLAIIDDLSTNPHSTPTDIRRRINLPRSTVDRQCQALHILRVLDCDEVEYGSSGKSRWHYSLADGIDAKALKTSTTAETGTTAGKTDTETEKTAPDLSVPTHSPSRESHQNPHPPGRGSDIPGEHSPRDSTQTNCGRCGHSIGTIGHEQNCGTNL